MSDKNHYHAGINVISYYHSVASVISNDTKDKICASLCRARKLNDTTLKLLLAPEDDETRLFDCAGRVLGSIYCNYAPILLVMLYHVRAPQFW